MNLPAFLFAVLLFSEGDFWKMNRLKLTYIHSSWMNTILAALGGNMQKIRHELLKKDSYQRWTNVNVFTSSRFWLKEIFQTPWGKTRQCSNRDKCKRHVHVLDVKICVFLTELGRFKHFCIFMSSLTWHKGILLTRWTRRTRNIDKKTWEGRFFEKCS